MSRRRGRGRGNFPTGRHHEVPAPRSFHSSGRYSHLSSDIQPNFSRHQQQWHRDHEVETRQMRPQSNYRPITRNKKRDHEMQMRQMRPQSNYRSITRKEKSSDDENDAQKRKTADLLKSRLSGITPEDKCRSISQLLSEKESSQVGDVSNSRSGSVFEKERIAHVPKPSKPNLPSSTQAQRSLSAHLASKHKNTCQASVKRKVLQNLLPMSLPELKRIANGPKAEDHKALAHLRKETKYSLSNAMRKVAEKKLLREKVGSPEMLEELGRIIDPDMCLSVCQMSVESLNTLSAIFNLNLDISAEGSSDAVLSLFTGPTRSNTIVGDQPSSQEMNYALESSNVPLLLFRSPKSSDADVVDEPMTRELEFIPNASFERLNDSMIKTESTNEPLPIVKGTTGSDAHVVDEPMTQEMIYTVESSNSPLPLVRDPSSSDSNVVDEPVTQEMIFIHSASFQGNPVTETNGSHLSRPSSPPVTTSHNSNSNGVIPNQEQGFFSFLNENTKAFSSTSVDSEFTSCLPLHISDLSMSEFEKNLGANVSNASVTKQTPPVTCTNTSLHPNRKMSLDIPQSSNEYRKRSASASSRSSAKKQKTKGSNMMMEEIKTEGHSEKMSIAGHILCEISSVSDVSIATENREETDLSLANDYNAETDDETPTNSPTDCSQEIGPVFVSDEIAHTEPTPTSHQDVRTDPSSLSQPECPPTHQAVKSECPSMHQAVQTECPSLHKAIQTESLVTSNQSVQTNSTEVMDQSQPTVWLLVEKSSQTEPNVTSTDEKETQMQADCEKCEARNQETVAISMPGQENRTLSLSELTFEFENIKQEMQRLCTNPARRRIVDHSIGLLNNFFYASQSLFLNVLPPNPNEVKEPTKNIGVARAAPSPMESAPMTATVNRVMSAKNEPLQHPYRTPTATFHETCGIPHTGSHPDCSSGEQSIISPPAMKIQKPS